MSKVFYLQKKSKQKQIGKLDQKTGWQKVR
jgi:hypothetical protein